MKRRTHQRPWGLAAARVALAGALAVVALSGCATDAGLRDEQRLALYRQHAGEPVDSIQYFGRISGWTPLGDRALALWTRPNQAYLLELNGPCMDLEYAHAIAVTNHFGRVHARFDDVRVLGTDSMRIPCRIQAIRPIDSAALKQAERDMREGVDAVEREQGASG